MRLDPLLAGGIGGSSARRQRDTRPDKSHRPKIPSACRQRTDGSGNDNLGRVNGRVHTGVKAAEASLITRPLQCENARHFRALIDGRAQSTWSSGKMNSMEARGTHNSTPSAGRGGAQHGTVRGAARDRPSDPGGTQDGTDRVIRAGPGPIE